ncbi:ABC transporter substrate-binding protein [Blastopirellula marina]|uniref:Protein kinase domain-containing protein n=1 Tax=Blastopirellula marina TaxID=124 RepID=A0A2S8GPF4_9BACT|nr:ABC transporter substrate-binding protein [Blastopirellula marina]PQO45884.1 hypothetical protein C5Y93_11550 [Blastopirellula marina]
MSQPNDADPDGPKVDISVVNAFQSACSRGERPRVDEFVAKAPLSLREATLQALNQIAAEQDDARASESATALSSDEAADPRSHVHATVELSPESERETVNDRAGSSPEHAKTGVFGSDATNVPDATSATLASWEAVIKVGDRLGKYHIRSILGIGGMGVVYAAFDTVIERDVAIKLLNTRHATSESAKRRLLQEAQAAGSLHHANIVGIYDVLIEGELTFVVMEYVRGQDLSEILLQAADRRLDWRLATQVVVECCDALSAAHRRGLYHRDIKPHNIMLTADNHAKLLDFGLAKSEKTCDTGLTQQGAILGTPDFMSPEQCDGVDITFLTDIYSLGATYFTLLAGSPPFASEGNVVKVMYAHCHKTVPTLPTEGTDIPAGCDAIIRKAMAKDPADRFQTADEMKSALERLLAGESLEIAPRQSIAGGETLATNAPAATASNTSPAQSRISRRSLVLGVLACGAAIPIAWMLANRSGTEPPTSGSDASGGAGANALLPPFRGVSPDKIHLGTTTVMNGPSEELGRSMVTGMRTYFAHVNENGGVHGRKIELTALDDRYNPEKALANMEEMFDDRDVFATIGNAGTPTAKLTSRFASDHKELFFAPLTGASFLREVPPDKYIFNYRASYQQETAALVDYFVDILNIAPDRIAVFAQNDSYGDDGYNGVVKALRRRGVKPDQILRTGYERNQSDIDQAIEDVLAKQDSIDAIVMVPTYKVAAKFIQRIRDAKPEMKFGTVSYVNSQALAEEFLELGPQYADGVIVTQVVPPPDSNATGVREYREMSHKHFPAFEPDFVSLEGFIAARILVEGLRKAGPELTTESLVDALHELKNIDLGIGPIISFSPSNHQASDHVWGTVFDDQAHLHSLDLEL